MQLRSRLLNRGIKCSPNIYMKFVVPTYKRSDSIGLKTLKTLKEGGVPKKLIWLFVANQSEFEDYKKNVDKELYGHLIIGELGLKNQRNFITNYFKENDKLVCLDDDVEKIERFVNEKKLEDVKDITAFCEKAFERCKKEKCRLWGVYPVHNAYFMKDKVTTDLRPIVGPFWGKVNCKNLTLTMAEKEDFERTLRNYTNDGKVIRYNNICYKTKYYTNKGGMQAEGKDRKAEALKSAHKLIELFPDLCKLYLKKKSGHPEVRLKDRRKKKSKFSGEWVKDCQTMIEILRGYTYYVGSTRSKMLYVKPGNGSVLYGTTWKGYLTTKADGTKIMREKHSKGKYNTNFKRDNPELGPILKEFQQLYFKDFAYNQVTINKNFPCPPHFDSKNCGESVLIAFGDYNGGSTCLFNQVTQMIEKFDARLKPLKFNGSKILHWVEPKRAGNKDRFSMVYYNH